MRLACEEAGREPTKIQRRTSARKARDLQRSINPPLSIPIAAIDAAASPRWVVIDKPAGLLSVPGKNPALPDAQSWCRARFPWSTGPLTVHRLDMSTSGLLLMALDPTAHRDLSAQFERRLVGKRYTALVRGVPAHAGGIIASPMRADITRRPFQIIDAVRGRPAVTSFRVLQTDSYTSSPVTRVALTPHTGRSHQLRLHMASIGCPIAGDELYGDPSMPASRLMLHAERLVFTDPTSGLPVVADAGAPF